MIIIMLIAVMGYLAIAMWAGYMAVKEIVKKIKSKS